MSMYFDVGDETLWNPSNGAGRLFLRQLEVFEAELELSSGIRQGSSDSDCDPDTLEIDPAVYADFVRGLVAWHCRTRHSVILALSEGFVATAVALARRAGIEGGDARTGVRPGKGWRPARRANPRRPSGNIGRCRRRAERAGTGDEPPDGPLIGRPGLPLPTARRHCRSP
ncbi:DUF6086 family protein [Streptomyces roseoverticillatus]|uniref:DUF6086 family protein n=1 Tax=Streptomyces roseoverticillatus TaxID=66429 RepID=UPI001FE0B2E8|nr:DUF6086 family protein [Streptomyces roseoverticillatus]